MVIAVFGYLHANISSVRNRLMFLAMKGLTYWVFKLINNNPM